MLIADPCALVPQEKWDAFVRQVEQPLDESGGLIRRGHAVLARAPRGDGVFEVEATRWPSGELHSVTVKFPR